MGLVEAAIARVRRTHSAANRSGTAGKWVKSAAVLLALLLQGGCDRSEPPALPPPATPTPVPTPAQGASRPTALHGTWVLDTTAASARDLPAAERQQLNGARLELGADGRVRRVVAGSEQAGSWETRGDELVLHFAPVLNEPGAAGSEDVLHYTLEEGGKALRLREEGQEFVWRRR